MRSTNAPTPTGNTKETTFMRAVMDKIKNQFNFFDSTTIRVEQTTRGIRFHARPQSRSAPAAPSGGLLTPFTITTISPTVGQDYFEAESSVDGSTALIAKLPEFRPSILAETIDTIPTTYVYSLTNADNVRVATDKKENSESQFCTPRYVVGQIIFAAGVVSTGGVATGVPEVDAQPTAWLDTTPRQWGGQNS